LVYYFAKWNETPYKIFGKKVSTQEGKKAKKLSPTHEEFDILDGTKHTHENFDILHFIILKYLAFFILYFMGN
jgi:hypothetical protein